MKRLVLVTSLAVLSFISIRSEAATRRIYINFNNQPAINNAATGSITPNTSPGIGDLRINYYPGEHTPSVLGTTHQYVAGRTGAAGDYALSGIIDGSGHGSWPYVYWYGVNQVVSWSENLYVSFWMKYVDYYYDPAYKSYENIKLFYWDFHPDPVSELMGEIAVTTANPSLTYNPSAIGYYYSWRGQTPYIQHYGHGYPDLADGGGGWHHYEFYIQRTAGRARLFVDGNVKIDWNTGDSNDFKYNNTFYIAWLHMPSIIGGFPKNNNGTRVIDDLEVWDGLPSGGDITAPWTEQHSPAKSSTGVAKTNRTIHFHVRDDTAVTTNGTVNIESVDYTCSAGLTCTGNGTNDVAVTYTKGSDWANDQVVNVSTTGFKDAVPNTMSADTWSYTIESASQPAPTIDTTSPLTTRVQGTAFTQTLSASGGTSPYTWSVTSGSLPTGTTLSSSGVFSGTPSAGGPYNFTAKIVDANAAEDTQAYAITVNPAVPGGQTTLNVTAIEDTRIRSASATTNYSTSNYLELWVEPLGTVAIRTLADITLGLPANVSIVSATLYAYMTSYVDSGGTNPANIYAYRISGTTPTISTVTWSSFAGTLETYESTAAVPLTVGWVSWDITDMAAWAYANSSHLFVALDTGGDGANGTNRAFTSMEGTEGYRPFVSITYMQDTSEGVSISAPGKMRVVHFIGEMK